MFGQALGALSEAALKQKRHKDRDKNVRVVKEEYGDHEVWEVSSSGDRLLMGCGGALGDLEGR